MVIPKLPKTGIVGYIRVSKEQSDTARQRKMIDDFAKKHNLKISNFYVDDVGSNPRDQPEKREGFGKMFNDVKHDRIHAIIVAEQDRFGVGNNQEFGYYSTILTRNDVYLISTTDGWLNNPDDVASSFTTTAKNYKSRQEQQDIGQRTLAMRRIHIEQGRWTGGYVPYGFDVACMSPLGHIRFIVQVEQIIADTKTYKRVKIEGETVTRYDGKDNFPKTEHGEHYTLIPTSIADRIKTVRKIFTMFATGAYSIRSIGTHLNKHKILPVNGLAWIPATIKGILRNPVYVTGKTVYNKQPHGRHTRLLGGEFVRPITSKGKTISKRNDSKEWIYATKNGEGIVSQEQFDAVQKLLDEILIAPRSPRTDNLFLSGLVACGTCGKRMIGRSQFGDNYICSTYSKYGKDNPTNCRLHRIKQSELETHLKNYLDKVSPDIRLMLDSQTDNSSLHKIFEKTDTYDKELWAVLDRMKQYLNERHVDYPESDTDEQQFGMGFLEIYQTTFQRDTSAIRRQLAKAEKRRDELLERFMLLPVAASEAMKAKAEILLTEADLAAEELKRQLEPLTERLEAIYSDLRTLDSEIDRLREDLASESKRERSGSIRKVIAKIVCNFEDSEPTTRKASGDVLKYRLKSVTFEPVLDSFFPPSQQGRGSQKESLGGFVLSSLTMTFPAIPATQSKASIIREAHRQGLKPREIIAKFGFNRNTVEKALWKARR